MKNLFFDVSTKDSIEIFSKLYNKNSNYLCVFFHWNKDDILSDKKYVDQFENKLGTLEECTNWLNGMQLLQKIKRAKWYIFLINQILIKELD